MKMKAIAVIGWAIGAMLLFTNPALSQSGGKYDLSWNTIDGGGATSSGGDFAVSGTIGQPDAGDMSGGDFTLVGGFWPVTWMCIVDLPDLSYFVEQWLATGAGLDADLYKDNKVDLRDYNVLASYWLNYCPPNWPW